MIKKKEVIILVTIVLLDMITKLAANYFLSLEEYVPLWGDGANFYLTYNKTATGVLAGIMLEEEYNKHLLLVLYTALWMLLLSYILLIRKKKLKVIYKILIGITLFIGLNVLLIVVYNAFIDINISARAASLFGKTGALAIYGSVFYLSKDKGIRLSALLICSAGIGNSLSYFYPPFYVIDFVFVDVLYDTIRLGVFNLADLIVDVGTLGLIVSLLVLLVKKVIPKTENRNT